MPARIAWGALNAVQLAFTLLWSAACITAALVVLLVSRRPALPLGMARWLWAPGLLHGAGARLDVAWEQALEPGAACLFASNHQSMIDIPTLFVALRVPLRFVVKRELGSIPFLGWYVSAMGMVLIDRGARSRAVRSIRRVTDLLRSGQCVACFPEGTRSRDGSVGTFKSGAFSMAIEAGVPVVPVALSGTGAVLPRSGFRVRPGTIRVRVGRPIPTHDLTTAGRAELAARVRGEVLRLSAGA
ncbi:MAG TPA: lysophospholipid acyltransferase family protein [Thermoanaerobaculaceae bacterium]|nr:lysophospholipid acyltransferase family protein [Thermoanaerobaculaceae bacterium]